MAHEDSCKRVVSRRRGGRRTNETRRVARVRPRRARQPLVAADPDHARERRRLEIAWTYHTGEMAPSSPTRQPREARGDAAHGRRTHVRRARRSAASSRSIRRPAGSCWKFDPKVDRNGRLRRLHEPRRVVRGWTAACRRQTRRARVACYLATIDGTAHRARRRTRDARVAAFGNAGTVDLRGSLRNKPFETAEYEVTSPPAIINGSSSWDPPSPTTTARTPRAARCARSTRALERCAGRGIRFRSDSTDLRGARGSARRRTRPARRTRGSVIAADSARDLVFVPTGSASPDYYGGERLGDNRYANSIVALRASTGRVVWHFQVVHHDLWDYDVASPPALVTLREGRPRDPVVLQATKTGQLFVLHRETGEPVFPVEERPVPASDVPASARVADAAVQHGPAAAQPAATNGGRSVGRRATEIARRVVRASPACATKVRSRRRASGGRSSIRRASAARTGADVAFDPVRQIAVVPVNRIPIEVRLIPQGDVRPAHHDRCGRVARAGRRSTRGCAGRRTSCDGSSCSGRAAPVLAAAVRVARRHRPQDRARRSGTSRSAR